MQMAYLSEKMETEIVGRRTLEGPAQLFKDGRWENRASGEPDLASMLGHPQGIAVHVSDGSAWMAVLTGTIEDHSDYGPQVWVS